MLPENTQCSGDAASLPSRNAKKHPPIGILALLGPTATGKSDCALRLAEELGLEILSCDSRQIYKGMSIGTAKPTVAEKERVRHWGIDIIDPSQAYSAFNFAHYAAEVINDRAAAGKKILICGGTGFYFKALTEGGTDYEPSDPQLRNSLNLFAEKHGNSALHHELLLADPISAARIHPNDRQRVLRALSIYKQTGLPMSVQQGRQAITSPYKVTIAKLSMPRELLYKKINQRVESMFHHGLWEEFCSLVAAGYTVASPGMQSVGYKELFGVASGVCTIAQAMEHIQQNTRNYAKRQTTWFSKQTPGAVFDYQLNYSAIKQYFKQAIIF